MIGVTEEAPRNILRAVALGGILFFVRRHADCAGDGDLTAMLPILGLYAFAGLRLLPALQMIYASLTLMRFTKPMLDRVHRDFTENLPQGRSRPPPDLPRRCPCASSWSCAA